MYLFGRLGTVATWGSASLRLLDGLWSDWRGRRVAVSGDGPRAVLAAAGGALKECVEWRQRGGAATALEGAVGASWPPPLAPSVSSVLEASAFSYVDPSGTLRGPFPAARVARWARRGAFEKRGFPLRHDLSGCWVSAWLLAEWQSEAEEAVKGGGEQARGNGGVSAGGVSTAAPPRIRVDSVPSDALSSSPASEATDMDWAAAADDLAAVRAAPLERDAAARVLRGEGGGGIAVDDGDWMALDEEETEELGGRDGGRAEGERERRVGAPRAARPASRPTTARTSPGAFPAAPGAAVAPPSRLVLVLDTSAALSRWSLLERIAEELGGEKGEVVGAPAVGTAIASSSPCATLYLPWVTLCELDALKDRERTSRAARAVLRRVEALSGGRDALVRVQGPREAAQAAASCAIPRVCDTGETLSDDAIVATALQLESRLRGSCVVLLVTEDGGMLVRGRAAGLDVVRPAAVPRTRAEVARAGAEAGGATGETDAEGGREETDASRHATNGAKVPAPGAGPRGSPPGGVAGAPGHPFSHGAHPPTAHASHPAHLPYPSSPMSSPRDSMHVESPRGELRSLREDGAAGPGGLAPDVREVGAAAGDALSLCDAASLPSPSHAAVPPPAEFTRAAPAPTAAPPRPARFASSSTQAPAHPPPARSACSSAQAAAPLFERASRCLPAALEAARRSLLGDLWLDSLPEDERPPWRAPSAAAGYLLEHVRTHAEVAGALRKEDHVVRRHPELYAPLDLDALPRRWRRSAEERPALAALHAALDAGAPESLPPLLLLHLASILQAALRAAQREIEGEPAPEDAEAGELWRRGARAAKEGAQLCERAREILEAPDR